MPRDILQGIAPIPGQQPQGGQQIIQQGAASPTTQHQDNTLLGDFLAGAAQGISFGFADELYGIGAGLIPGGQNREEATAAARRRLETADPRALLAGEVAGSLVIPGGAARTGASLGARALRGATVGAAQGAVGAAGRQEGGVEDRLTTGTAIGAGLGAGLGGAGAAAGPAIAGAVRRLADRRQTANAAQRLTNTITRDDDVGEMGQRAVRAIQEAEQVGKKGVNKAYEKVANLEGAIEDRSAFELLSGKLHRLIDDEGYEFLEGGDRIIGLVDDTIGRLEGNATVRNIENARQRIAAVGRNANPVTKEAVALGAIRQEFDDWMFDTLTHKIYRGDEKVIGQIKEARQLAREYHRVFGIGGRTPQDQAAGRIINQIIKDGADEGEAINLIFGVSNLGVKGSRKALARIRDVSPDAMEALQSAHFMKMVTGDGGGDFLPATKIRSKFQKLMTNQGAMMRTLYGEEGLKSIGVMVDQLPTGGVAGKVSDYLRSRPGWLALITSGGVAGAYTQTQDPYSAAGFGGLLLGAFSAFARGGGVGAGTLINAARPQATALTGPATSVGGGIGGMVGGRLE